MMPTAHVLTLPSEANIDELGEHFEGIGKDAYAKMLTKLKTISDDMEKRKEGKREGQHGR